LGNGFIINETLFSYFILLFKHVISGKDVTEDIGMADRWNSLSREKYSRIFRLSPLNNIYKFIYNMSTLFIYCNLTNNYGKWFSMQN